MGFRSRAIPLKWPSMEGEAGWGCREPGRSSGRMTRTCIDANYPSYILTVPDTAGGHGGAMTVPHFTEILVFRRIEGVGFHSQRNPQSS
jgi:hypothetical protein